MPWTLSGRHWSAHQPRSQFPGPPEWFPEPTGEFVVVVGPTTIRTKRRRVGGLQCGNSRRWLGICSGSVSHVLAPFRQVTSRVAHRYRVECAVIHPSWWWIFNRMEVKHALSPSPQEVRRTWFSHGPLASLGPLHGGEHRNTVPGQGPQSSLFCPIISLALAVVERAQGVTPFSTGPRSAVTPAQQQYWMTHAAAIVCWIP